MREWVVQQLTGDAQFPGLFPGGLHQASSMAAKPSQRPYATYRFGVATAAFNDDGTPQTILQPFTIWAYDEPGDYQRIDDGLYRIRTVLTAAIGAPGNGIIRATWNGASDDLIDPDLELILRNNRFNLYYREGA